MWIDHRKAQKFGGTHALKNLACVSAFHNWKKGSNSRDSLYLFEKGLPTENYYYRFGALSGRVGEHLNRFLRLDPSDWYFNKGLVQIDYWLHDAYWGWKYKRGKRYHANAALRRFLKWREFYSRPGYISLEQRGLVRFPRRPDTKIVLSIMRRQSLALRDVWELMDCLFPYFKSNMDFFYRFIEAVTHLKRSQILKTAKQNPRLHPDMLEFMSCTLRAASKLERIVAPW